MRYDDRLSTVLGLAAAGPHERAVQWRQLVELVARGAGGDAPDLRERALARIAGLMLEVPEDVRAAAARAIAGPDVPAELVALFAADGLEVAAPVITAAELGPAGWAAVRTVASGPVAAMLAALRPERADIRAEVTVPSSSSIAPPVPLPDPLPDVSQPQVDVAEAPAAARAEARPTLLPAGIFRWECGPTGEIDWVEGAPRAALIGRSLAEELDRRFADRLPFEDEPLVMAEAGLLAGEWRWSGIPSFFPDTGRFAGYRGTARREGASSATVEHASPALDSDSLRELVHELRTPLNAIIGFGEIIEGQYLGPAHRPYRERASSIVRQARLLADAVEDLDFAARLQSGREEAAKGESFDTIFPPIRLALLEQAAESDVTLTISMRTSPQSCAVHPKLATRLMRRFLSTVVASAAAGERLEMVVDRIGRHLAIAVDRPQSARGLSEEQLMDPALPAGANGPLGLGFALRLVRGLASMAGGGLDVAPERLVLLLAVESD